ncbi:mandelate racemase/muconate lactonizing enzyme family protein [Campylobacter sp. 2014D-0216]|uniref:mandelate racemase/muconate lactonizing enzyme family protein n=1 Tax=Campylobacter sp. 2014D-0216 TaxID=1813595 RepID=UPI0018A5DAA8|nr:mandelate racemase/muconate lactonizing enzyme family protein [Campylobacter sp. 2014D-0216]QOR01539.1 mandelate racemase/muconate lactonizing enzyme family protein [Campylobacter sp. 2014D-0216]
MKIVKVEPIWLRVKPFNEPCEWGEDAFILKIHTDNNLYGIGESDSAAAVLKMMFEQPSTHGSCRNLSEILLGQDPRNIKKIMDDLLEGSAYYGYSGALICALSAINIALYDLLGKIYGVSVAVLLGGKRKDYLNAYATFIPSQDLKANAVKAKHLKSEGFKLLKFGGAGFGSNALSDKEIIQGIRETVGDEVKLSIDLVGLWKNFSYARERFLDIKEYNLEWIEEPVGMNNVCDYARLSEHLPCKITGGEGFYTQNEFENFIKKSKVSIVQPDITRCGGFDTMVEVEKLSLKYGCDLVPHGFSTGILLAATVQFLASSKHCDLIEYSQSTSALYTHLVKNLIPCKDGIIAIEDVVGIGVELNEELIKQYRIDIKI